MKIIYLKTIENWQEAVNGNICKWNSWIKKLEYQFRKIFNIPLCYSRYPNKMEYILPYTSKETKAINKFFKKRKNVQGIVLDKELIQNKEICEILEKKDIYVFNGKWLFKYLIIETLEYICKKSKLDIKDIKIAILLKDTSDDAIQTIYKIVNKVKNISIVTTQILKFHKIESVLYKEMGIPIKVSNNKNKSLKKEKIIINMDFNEKELNSYKICEDAIIININNNIENISKSFHGININNLEIQKTEFDIKGFYSNCIYESNIFQKDSLENIRKCIIKDRISIKYLIGKRGKIVENEYKEFCKNY